MLNLFSPFVVPGVDHVTVYQDDEDPLLFWMLPGKPSLVTDENGEPAFSLTTYALDLDLVAPPTAGEPAVETEIGALALEVEVAVSRADQDRILDYLRSEVLTSAVPMVMAQMRPDGQVGAVMRPPVWGSPRLSYPVWIDGTVKLTVVPDGGSFFVAATGGAEKPPLTGSNFVYLAARLTQNGVRAVQGAIDTGLFQGGVTYQLSHQVRIPGIRIDISGNAEDAYRELKDYVTVEGYQNGRLVRSFPQVSSLDELRTKMASVKIYYSVDNIAQIGGEERAAFDAALKPFEAFVFEIAKGYLLDNFFTPAFSPDLVDKALGTDPLAIFAPTGTPALGNNRMYLKHTSQVVQGDFSFSLDGRISFPITTSPSAMLMELVDVETMRRHTSRVDLDKPVMPRIDVPVRITADFERDPIAMIEVTVNYRETDEMDDGKIVAKNAMYLFETGEEVYYFHSTVGRNADGTLKEDYSYSSTIHYKASAADESTPVSRGSGPLVIGYDGLSCVQVECIAGDIPWTVVDRVDVQLRYPGLDTPSATGRLSLAGDDTRDKRWFTYTEGNPSREYEYQPTFVLKDGQKIAPEPIRETANRLRIDAPFAGRLAVTFTAQGAFPPIRSIGLQVRYRDPAHDYAVDDAHTFAASAQTWEWTAWLRDAAVSTFEYKADIAYADGTVEHGEWKRESSRAVDVGEVIEKMLAVSVYPTVLDMTRWKLVLVRLRYVDPAGGEVQEKTVQFTPAGSTEPVVWTVALSDGAARSYSYQVQAWGEDGSKVSTEPRTTDTTDLIIEL